MSEDTIPTTSTSEKGKRRRGAPPEVLRHQKSFENRYGAIIYKQILETSINRDELQRQLHAYFPITRSSSLQTDGAEERRNEFACSEPVDVRNPKESTTPQKKVDENLTKVTEEPVKQQGSPKK